MQEALREKWVINMVKFNDLSRHHAKYKDDFLKIFEDTLINSSFIGGAAIKEFEKQFAYLIGVKYAIGCGNGTDAIYIALKSLGVSVGDEVIVPAQTWISTAEAVSQTGARPVFCDVNSEDWTIDVTQIEKLITKSTRALIVVHLYGFSCDLGRIKEICHKNKINLIEDCAQAHLTKYNGQAVGTFGDIATFSFYPGKNLGALGDAGCIVTNNHILEEYCRRFSNHGALVKGQHSIEGLNSRLDTLQARFLTRKLVDLEENTRRRFAAANYYTKNLNLIDEMSIPQVPNYCSPSYHLYTIYTQRRDELKDFLETRSIETVINYKKSLPELDAYILKGYRAEDFPNAVKNAAQTLSLPLFPEIEQAEQDFVIDSIKMFFNV